MVTLRRVACSLPVNRTPTSLAGSVTVTQLMFESGSSWPCNLNMIFADNEPGLPVACLALPGPGGPGLAKQPTTGRVSWNTPRAGRAPGH